MQNREAIAVAARAVIRQHGDGAIDHAKKMARRYTKAGDRASAREWLRIMRVIGETIAIEGKESHPAPETAKPAA